MSRLSLILALGISALAAFLNISMFAVSGDFHSQSINIFFNKEAKAWGGGACGSTGSIFQNGAGCTVIRTCKCQVDLGHQFWNCSSATFDCPPPPSSPPSVDGGGSSGGGDNSQSKCPVKCKSGSGAVQDGNGNWYCTGGGQNEISRNCGGGGGGDFHMVCGQDSEDRPACVRARGPGPDECRRNEQCRGGGGGNGRDGGGNGGAGAGGGGGGDGAAALELPKAQCEDGIDNDNDGKIDSADPGCLDASGRYNPSDNDEFNFRFRLREIIPDFFNLNWFNLDYRRDFIANILNSLIAK